MSNLIASVKEATRFIARKGNRTRMVVAGILLMFALVLPMMGGLYSIYIAFSKTEVSELVVYGVVYGVALAFGILVALPAVTMFVTYSQRVYSETKYGYADIKRRGAYNYFRSLFATLILFIRPLIVLIMVQLAYMLSRDLRSLLVTSLGVYIPTLIILIPAWCIVLAISAVFMWVTNSVFLAPYYYSRGMSAVKAISKSRKVTARHPFYCDLFSILFIALSAISLLTFGVLFILWVLPLMMFTYYELADRMDGEK